MFTQQISQISLNLSDFPLSTWDEHSCTLVYFPFPFSGTAHRSAAKVLQVLYSNCNRNLAFHLLRLKYTKVESQEMAFTQSLSLIH